MTASPPTRTDVPFDSPNAVREVVCEPADPAAPANVNLPIPWRSYRFTPDEVAALSAARILVMSRPELIGVIDSVRGGHLRPGVLERLPQMDGETLRRLVFLTRRFCRNQQSLAEPLAALMAGCPR